MRNIIYERTNNTQETVTIGCVGKRLRIRDINGIETSKKRLYQ